MPTNVKQRRRLLCVWAQVAVKKKHQRKQQPMRVLQQKIGKRKEIEEKAEKKREDIGEALESRTEERGMRGGSGRRSLFQASGGGFLGRYS